MKLEEQSIISSISSKRIVRPLEYEGGPKIQNDLATGRSICTNQALMQWNEIFIESDILWYKSVLREQANTFFHGPKVITLGCTLESPKSFCLSVLHKLYPQYLYLIVLDWCPGNRNFYKCPQAFINSYLQSYLQILICKFYLQILICNSYLQILICNQGGGMLIYTLQMWRICLSQEYSTNER